MSFDQAVSKSAPTETSSGAEPARAGRSTQSGGLAEMGGGAARAHYNGALAEGQTGIKATGGGGKQMIGVISGGSFKADASAAPEAPAPTLAKGADGERAYVGTPSTADRDTKVGKTSVHMVGETEAQARMIAAAIARATTMLDHAIATLGSPESPKTKKALQDNFHDVSAQTVAKVLSVLQKTRAAFNGTIPVEAETEGTSRAYVYVLWSNIHLCPPWFADADPDGRARTMIHECTHKYCGTDDEAYHWDGKYATLTPKQALNNADSYAWYCIDVR